MLLLEEGLKGNLRFPLEEGFITCEKETLGFL
jgi:hypothetical protein